MASAMARGAGWEWTLASRLRAAGWHVVRASGSHGPADLYGWETSRGWPFLWLLQAKTARAHLPGPAERDALDALASLTGGTWAVVQRGLVGRKAQWRVWDGRRWMDIPSPLEGGAM